MIEKILSKMTLKEKIEQLTQISYCADNVKEIKEEVEIIPEDEVANSEIGGGNNE